MKTNKLMESEKREQNAEKWPKVAIIILNYNGWQDTLECLESLQRLTYPNYQIILVDNGSTDDSVEKIRAWAKGEVKIESNFFREPGPKPVTIIECSHPAANNFINLEVQLKMLPSAQCLVLIRNKNNLGFAGGNNIAIQYALQNDYPYIALLNNDTVVDPHYLEPLVNILEKNSLFAAVGPKILYKEKPQHIWFAGMKVNMYTGKIYHICVPERDILKGNKIRLTESLTGCAFVARSEIFEKVGLLDNEYFLVYEDIDFFWRARKKRFLLGVNLASKVYHKSGATFVKREGLYQYFYCRNRLLFIKKNASAHQKFVFFLFYIFSRPICFLLRILKGRTKSVFIEVVAIYDFLRSRKRKW